MVGLDYFICNRSKYTLLGRVVLTHRALAIISGTLLSTLHMLNHLSLTKSDEVDTDRSGFT